MNKNTILAFSLIILTILFFNSPLYNKTYEKLFHNSRNSNQINNEKEETKENNIKETNEVKKTIINNENRQLSAIAQQSDSNKQLVNKDTIGDTIWVENEKILCGITEIGAKIISIKMKEYFYSKKNDDTNSLKRNIEIVSNSELGGGNLEINGIKFDSKKFKIYILDKNIKVSKSEKKYLTFSYIDEGKNELIKRYAFEGDSYKIGYEIISKSLDGKSIVVGWKGGINESENNNIKQSSMSGVNEPRKVHFYDSKNVGHIQLKKVEKEKETGFYK